MNHTQQLCECPSNYNWECSADPDIDDGHTVELTRRYDKKVATSEIKLCSKKSAFMHSLFILPVGLYAGETVRAAHQCA